MIRLAAVLTLCAAPAFAQPCHERDHIAAFLETRHGLALHSWGLSDAGDMMELFLGERGHWAVITTKPNRCATVDMPHKERGRLWAPPKPNSVMPDAPMNYGSAL
jgi:hypothetical protein